MQTASGQANVYNTGANIERSKGKKRRFDSHIEGACLRHQYELQQTAPLATKSGVHRLWDTHRKAESKFVKWYRDRAHCLGARLGFNSTESYNILPTSIYLMPLWNFKVGVWCASRATRIIYPLFSKTTNPNGIIQILTTLLNTCPIMSKSMTFLSKTVPEVTLQTILSC